MDRTNKPETPADDHTPDPLDNLILRALGRISPEKVKSELTRGFDVDNPYDITPPREECEELLKRKEIIVGDEKDIDHISEHTLFVLKPNHETQSFVLNNLGVSKLVDKDGQILDGSITVRPGDVIEFLEPIFPGEAPVSVYIRIPNLYDPSANQDLNTSSAVRQSPPNQEEVYQQELLDAFLSEERTFETGDVSYSVRYPSSTGTSILRLHMYGATPEHKGSILAAFGALCETLPKPMRQPEVPDVLRKIRTICILPKDEMKDRSGQVVDGFWSRRKGVLALSEDATQHVLEPQPQTSWIRNFFGGKPEQKERLLSLLSSLPEDQSFFMLPKEQDSDT